MINFALSEEQEQIRDMLNAFARNELGPRARAADESRSAPADLLDAAWELGLTALSIPESYGGGGAPRSAMTSVLCLEATGYGCSALAASSFASMLFVNPLVDLGSDEQKKRHLPLFCSDRRRVATMAAHESGFSSDLVNTQTTAVPTAEGWRISGRKRFVPMARHAGEALVLARVGPLPGAQGVKAFIVPLDIPGVTVVPEVGAIGLNALEFAELKLDDVVLPRTAILGGGEGADIRPLLASIRIGGAALAVGVARAVTDFAIPYAKERVAFGSPIAKKQAIAFMLAEMRVECDAMRWMVWKAAAEYDAGRDATKAAVLAQNYVNRRALKVADDGLQIFGGHGYIRDLPLEMWLRNVRALTIREALAAA